MSVLLSFIIAWVIMIGGLCMNLDDSVILICISIILAGGLAGMHD